MNNSCEASAGQVEQSPKTPKGRKLVQGRLPFAAVDNKSKSAHVANKNCEDEPKKEKLELSINSESEDKDFEDDCLISIPNGDQSVLSTSINLNSSLEKETPKKTEQARKKREEKLKEKELREKKKAEEKALKEQQKKEKEEEKKKREELKELEKKRKEEERKKKEEEKEADKRRKEEEKKKKEEEKEAEKKRKDEEKKRKEEEKENEKKRKEEEERKKKERLSQVFSNFFTQKKSTPAKSEVKGEAVTLAFPPFQVKDNMKLAPLVRTDFDLQRREELDSVLNNKLELSSSICLMNLKSGRKTGATWPLARESEMDNEVEVIEEEEGLSNKQNVIRVIPSNCKRARAKLLQFCENRRPAYWGTWGKRSKTVKPCRPFGRDAVFDYEIDSDDEWEEIEPGESLTDNEDEDKEPVDDYEVDNDFLVPHGYLSEEEGENDEDEKPLSPSAAKEQLKIKEEQFERELKEKTHHIKPSLIGCCWSECLDEEPHLLKVLKRYAAVIVSEHNIVSLALNDLGDDDASNLEDVRSDNKISRRPINDEDIPVLLKILHGSTYSKVTIVKEFLTYLKQSKAEDTKNAPSKAKILSKIAEIASWGKCSEPGPMNGRVCWLVHAEILQRYNLQDLSVVNSWEFSTDIKKRGRTKTDDSKLEEETPPTKTPRMSLIRKFADAVVPMQSPNKEEEEVVKNAESKTSETNANSSTPAPKAKKRIALISLSTSASKKIKSEVKSTPLTNFLKRVTTKENPELKPLETDDATDMDGIECLE